MSFIFKPAIRENVPLLIGLVSGTGGGKTYTAMRLATGLSGGKPFAVIDTESGRALHYADRFKFDHGALRPPFRPSAYLDAIQAADKAQYPVIVVDSMSHEHAGDGGLLDWHDEELDRMAGDDWKKREACKMAAWIKPKMSHKEMMSKLLQLRAHLILCFRAEEKIEMVKEDGKMVVRPKRSLTGLDGWLPVCEKSIPFELTASLLFLASDPGKPVPIKLEEQMRDFFPRDRQVDESSGERLAAWSHGAKADGPVPKSPMRESDAVASSPTITADQAIYLSDLCKENNIAVQALCNAAKVKTLESLPADAYERSKAWIETVIEKRNAK